VEPNDRSVRDAAPASVASALVQSEGQVRVDAELQRLLGTEKRSPQPPTPVRAVVDKVSKILSFCECLYDFELQVKTFSTLGSWAAFREHLCEQPDILYVPVDEVDRETATDALPVFLIEYVFDATLAYWRQRETGTAPGATAGQTSPAAGMTRAFWTFWADTLELIARQTQRRMPVAVVKCLLRWIPAIVRAFGQADEPRDPRCGVALRCALQSLGRLLSHALCRVPNGEVARQVCTAIAKVVVRMLWPSQQETAQAALEWALDRLHALLDGVGTAVVAHSAAPESIMVLVRELQRRLGSAIETMNARFAVPDQKIALPGILATMERALHLVHDLEKRLAAHVQEHAPATDHSSEALDAERNCNTQRRRALRRASHAVGASDAGNGAGVQSAAAAAATVDAMEAIETTVVAAAAAAAAQQQSECRLKDTMDSTATTEVVLWSQLENAVQVLHIKPAADWEKRVEALVFIEERAQRLSRADLAEFLRQSSLRYALVEQIQDLRSQVARHACATAATLARALGDAFADTLGLVLVPSLLRASIVTIAVIADSARQALRCIVEHARLGRSVIFLFQGLQDQKSATSLREITAELLYVALARQPAFDIERHAEEWRRALRTGLEDASACVRARMRHAFWRYVAFLCWQALRASARSDAHSSRYRGASGMPRLVAFVNQSLERDVLQALRQCTRRTLMEHCPRENSESIALRSPSRAASGDEHQHALFSELYAAVCESLSHPEQTTQRHVMNKENQSPFEAAATRKSAHGASLGSCAQSDDWSGAGRVPTRALGGALRVGVGRESADENVDRVRRHARLLSGHPPAATSPERPCEQAWVPSREYQRAGRAPAAAAAAAAAEPMLPLAAKWRPARRTVAAQSPLGEPALAPVCQREHDNDDNDDADEYAVPAAEAMAQDGDGCCRGTALQLLVTRIEDAGADWRRRLDALIALEEEFCRQRSASAAASAAAAAAATPGQATCDTVPFELIQELIACLHRCLAEKQHSVLQQTERVLLAILALVPDMLAATDLEQALHAYPLLGRLLNQWPRTQPILVAFIPRLALDAGLRLFLRHCSMEPLRNAAENAHPRLAERTLLFLDACFRATEPELVAWQRALLGCNAPTGRDALSALVARLHVLHDRTQIKQPLVRRAAAQLLETLRSRADPILWAPLVKTATTTTTTPTPCSPETMLDSNNAAHLPRSPAIANRHRLHCQLALASTDAVSPVRLRSPAPRQRSPARTQLQLLNPESLEALRQVRVSWRNRAAPTAPATATATGAAGVGHHEACAQAHLLLDCAAQRANDLTWQESALRTAIELVRHIGAALLATVPDPGDAVAADADAVLRALLCWALTTREQAKPGSLLRVSANRLARAIQVTFQSAGRSLVEPCEAPTSAATSTNSPSDVHR